MIRIDSLAAFRILSTVRSGQIRSFDSSKYKVLEIQLDKVKKKVLKRYCVRFEKCCCIQYQWKTLGNAPDIQVVGYSAFYIPYQARYCIPVLDIPAKYRISEKVTYKTRRRNLLYNIVQKITVKRQNSKPPQKIVYHCKMSKYSVLI